MVASRLAHVRVPTFAGTVAVVSGHDRGDRVRVVIAGGGVAAAEMVLAVRALAGDRVALTMVSPEPEFRFRGETVREPFGGPVATRYRLEAICADIRADLVIDKLRSVDVDLRRLSLERGGWLYYDVLVVAVGAIAEPVFKFARTFLADRWYHDLRLTVESVEGGYARRVAFVAPPHAGWTLPIYEMALLTAASAAAAGRQAELTVITLEPAPLAAFAGAGRQAVADLLAQAGIDVTTDTYVTERNRASLELHPGGQTLDVDRVVALPELRGPKIPGLPMDDRGFIPVEHDNRVCDHDAVFAVGDVCDFPIKQGGLATQQADAAAATIASHAGAGVRPGHFRPVLRAKLLTGDTPLYLRAHLTGDHTTGSVAATHCLWWPAEKVAGRYLTTYLAERGLQPIASMSSQVKAHGDPPAVVHSAPGDLEIEMLDEQP
jgi:sulfide:quinone oxidoreductase